MPIISKETISLSGSLILGNREINKNDKAPTPLIYGEPLGVESFGLFETSSPNFNNYYPDVNKDDLAPKDDEYIFPIFRGLSECIVRPQFPIDFGVGDALKNSIPLLRGIAVYPNHEMITGDELGVVYACEWQEARTIATEQGELFIPAGINLTYKIDGKSNPRIARNIVMDPPAIHSTSLTVEFSWEKSHADLSDDEFWSKLGTYDKDGNLVKRNVVQILRYYEASLVSHGADPFAKLLDANGNPAIPNSIKATYQFSEVDSHGNQRLTSDSVIGHNIDWKSKTTYTKELLTEDSSKSSIPTKLNNDNNNNEKPNSMNKLKELLAACVALQALVPADVDTDEKFVKWLGDNQTSLTEATTALNTEKETVTRLTGEVTGLNSKVTALEAELGTASTQLEEVVTAQRNEAIRLYSLCNAGKTEETLLKLMGEADYKTSKSFVEQYAAIAKEKFGETVDQQDDNKGKADGAVSLEEAAESLFKSKTQINTSNFTEKQ